ncbi:hypothetical protein [Gordonia westfalica]|nr:hypothetical protein [Gordonia westfalica]
MSSGSHLVALLSSDRLAPYLREADGDEALALRLYEWNTQISAASMEVLAYLEVLLRNAIDRELTKFADESRRGLPWFMLPSVNGPSHNEITTAVETTRGRLRGISPRRDARGQIIAGLSFGFWTAFFKAPYEDLWRSALTYALPGTPSGSRKNVIVALERTRKFRNRLAHHDSLLAQDILLELDTMLSLVEWIDPDARIWLDGIQRVTKVYTERPVAPVDTLVVPAGLAWPLYQSTSVYICPPDRNFRPADYMAFYADKEIKPEVPAILHHRPNVVWTSAEAARLQGLAGDTHKNDRKIGKAITASLSVGWTHGRYQVFLLSSGGHPKHLTLAKPIPHLSTGRGSAYVQRHRYTTHHSLETATSTDELV